MAPHCRVAVGIFAAACLSAPLLATAQDRPVGPREAAALVEFASQINAYVALHRRLEGPVPAPKVSNDPAEIRRAVEALAKTIRAARAGAKQGDIFSPDIAVLFRRLIRESCGGKFAELLAMTLEETPALGRPHVNGPWPGISYTFMPPNLLSVLPPLPEELEYRFVNRDLVLWDCHANLVVDFISDAIPRDTE